MKEAHHDDLKAMGKFAVVALATVKFYLYEAASPRDGRVKD